MVSWLEKSFCLGRNVSTAELSGKQRWPTKRPDDKIIHICSMEATAATRHAEAVLNAALLSVAACFLDGSAAGKSARTEAGRHMYSGSASSGRKMTLENHCGSRAFADEGHETELLRAQDAWLTHHFPCLPCASSPSSSSLHLSSASPTTRRVGV